ncbi:MAG: TraM recognition domain-containing protein [Patescibacteria group bacterium]
MRLRILEALRSLARGSAQHEAAANEGRALDVASSGSRLPPRLHAESGTADELRPGHFSLGTFVDEPGRTLLLPVVSRPVHSLLLGSTGVGKTWLQLRALEAKFDALLRGYDAADRVAILDAKGGDLASLAKEVLLTLLPGVPIQQAEHLLERLVVVAPFSTTHAAPMNLLYVDDARDLEANAFDMAGLLSRMSGSALGVHQDRLVYSATLLGGELARRDEGFNLYDLASALGDPARLAGLAQLSTFESVRNYFAGPNGLSAGSLHGVRARLERLLRLGASRMLRARRCLDFGAALRDGVVIIDMGGAPLGAPDIANFYLGMIASRLLRSLNARTGTEPQLVLVIDEFQRAVRAQNWLAESLEDVLAVCRSRRVRLVLASQSLDAIREVSTALPRIALTNCDVIISGRANTDDARSLSPYLHLSGRVPRPPVLPWEERRGGPFLTQAEERAALTVRLTRLEHRQFLYADKSTGEGGAFIKSADVTMEVTGEARREWGGRVECGAVSAEATARVPRRVTRLATGAGTLPSAPPSLPRRRGRRRTMP